VLVSGTTSPHLVGNALRFLDSAQWLFEGVKSSRELAVLVPNEPRRKSERHSLSYCGPLVAVMQDKDLTFKRGSSNNEASPTNWPR